jgi:predicted phage tail protein
VSQDSERTVSEAGAEEAVTQVEQTTMESPHPKVVVTVVEKLAAGAAGGSTMQDTALVVVSTSLSCPLPLVNVHIISIWRTIWCWSSMPPIICQS